MAAISRLYKDHDTGARVVAELERLGIPHSDISIISNNDSGWFNRDGSDRTDRDADKRGDRSDGAAAGAGIGAAVGGVAGLLAGLGLLAIPGIGPVVAAGWLASTAAVAAAGGATGGLIGALTRSGVGEHEAHAYAEGVRRGGTLVTVRVPDTDRARVDAIMDRYSPMDTMTMGTANDAGDRSSDRIIAAFENADRARAARKALTEAGIHSAKIELLNNRSDLDNWTAMKRHAVPDEDAHVYAEGLGRGHSIMVVRANAGEHDAVRNVLERCDPIDIDDHAASWRNSGWSGVHAGKAAWDLRRHSAPGERTVPPAGSQEQVIPVYEEALKVGKRTVEQGRVRVRVYTVEHPVQEGLTLREERVAVERQPVGRPVSEVPGDAFQQREVDLKTHREEPVIAKEARVKEEVHVRKEADERTETVRDTVRHTEVEVDDDRAKASSPAGSPSPRPQRE